MGYVQAVIGNFSHLDRAVFSKALSRPPKYHFRQVGRV